MNNKNISADKLLKNQIKYPTIVVDNFFKNPNVIREFALNLSYESAPDGRWPGERSIMLHKVNQKLYFLIVKKILSVYYDLNNTDIKWDDIQMMFQKVKKFNESKNTVENKGWIHLDEYQTFAGVVFLTPDIDLDCGTSIFKLKKEYKDFDLSSYVPKAKFQFYGKNCIEKNNYNKEFNDLYKKFEPITIVKNIYNRLIIFDSKEYHAANNYFSDGQERLTLIFFFKNVKERKQPLDKIQEFDKNIEDEILNYYNENIKSEKKLPEQTNVSDK